MIFGKPQTLSLVISQFAVSCKYVKNGLRVGFLKISGNPVKSDTPVLILTGALDHTTPTRYGDTAVRMLTSGRHLILPSRSHNDVDPCVTRLIEAFMIS